ncbi:MAG: universal stress protein [Candidatus Nitrosopolaris sp.]
MNADNTVPELTPGSEISRDQTSSDIPKIQYNGILVPHDGTEKSDKALGHAIYLSKLSGAEIIILNVIEHVKDTDSSALIATSKGQPESSDSANAKLEVTIYGGVKKDGGRKNKLMQTSRSRYLIKYKQGSPLWTK